MGSGRPAKIRDLSLPLISVRIVDLRSAAGVSV